jgi:hypothetical protein
MCHGRNRVRCTSSRPVPYVTSQGTRDEADGKSDAGRSALCLDPS